MVNMKVSMLRLWYVSIVFFCAAPLCLFCMMMWKATAAMALLCVAVLATAVTLNLLSSSKLTFKEGYTLPQAIQFYKKCVRADIKTKAGFYRKYEQVKAIAAKTEATKKPNKDALYMMFFRGKTYVETKMIAQEEAEEEK